MSSISACALSNFVPSVFTFGPVIRFTYSCSNTAFIGFSALNGSFTCSSSAGSSTAAFFAASYAVSS